MGNEYTFRVRGRLSPDILAALEPLAPVEPVTETELRGVLVDGAALHGMIARLEQLGVELIGLTRLSTVSVSTSSVSSTPIEKVSKVSMVSPPGH